MFTIISQLTSFFAPLDLRASLDRVRTKPKALIMSAIAAIQAGGTAVESAAVSAAGPGRSATPQTGLFHLLCSCSRARRAVTHLVGGDMVIHHLVQAALQREEAMDGVHGDDREAYLRGAGVSTKAEYALLKLDEMLDQAAKGILSREQEGLVVLIPTKTVPDPLPDLIGTREAPGRFCTAVDARLAAIEANPPKAWLSTDSERAAWLAKLTSWKADWAKMKTQLFDKPNQTFFSMIDAERKMQYEAFAYRIDECFHQLVSQDQDSYLFDQLEDIRPNCRTGWDERIDQLSRYTGVAQPLDYQLAAHLMARDLRREVMLAKVLPLTMEAVGWSAGDASNVHSQHAAKQWGNKPYHLGYSREDLGADHEALTTAFESRGEAFQVTQISFDEHYTKELLAGAFQAYYKGLGEEARSTFFQPILDAYQEAIIAGQAPLLDDNKELKSRYEQLEAAAKAADWDLLRTLHSAFQTQGVQPSYRTVSLRQKLNADLADRDWSFFINGSLRREMGSASLGALLPRLQEAVLAARANNELSAEDLPKKEGWIREMEQWIAAFAQSEQADKELAFQRVQIAQALSMSTGYQERLALINRGLLVPKLAIGKELKPLGLELWLASAKLSKPVIDAGELLSKQEELLVWASHLPLVKADQLIVRLDKLPKLYLLLADADRTRPEVLAKVAANPGLVYGISRVDYDSILADPVAAIKNPDFAWMRSIQSLVLLAVQSDGKALEYAAPALTADSVIVRAALAQNGYALVFADRELAKDRDIILTAVTQNGDALRYAAALTADLVIVLAAVKQQGDALQYADPKLKKNRAIVLAAVKQNGFALKHADDELKTDREMALAAVTQNSSVLRYVDPELAKDPAIVLVAVKQDGYALKHADTELKKDRAIVLAAVMQAGPALQYADSQFTKDREVVVAAVVQNGFALQHADRELRDDKDFVLALLLRVGKGTVHARAALQRISARLQADPEIIAAVG